MSIFFIAEIGINHNGDMATTKKLINVAKEAKCDAVKFQKRDVDIVYTKEYLDNPEKSEENTKRPKIRPRIQPKRISRN